MLISAAKVRIKCGSAREYILMKLKIRINGADDVCRVNSYATVLVFSRRLPLPGVVSSRAEDGRVRFGGKTMTFSARLKWLVWVAHVASDLSRLAFLQKKVNLIGQQGTLNRLERLTYLAGKVNLFCDDETAWSKTSS